MSPGNIKLTVLITVVAINLIKHLSSAQSFRTHPGLFNPIFFNRRMLLYPNNFRNWPKPLSSHCCSNSNADLIRYHGENRINNFESTSFSTERVESLLENSKNFGLHETRTITHTMQPYQATSPLLTKLKTLDYHYLSAINNRLRLRSSSTERLMKSDQGENSLKSTKYIFLSTTEKLIRSETTERYFVSDNPTQIFDESESESEKYNIRVGFSASEPLTTVPSEERNQNSQGDMEPEHIEQIVDTIVPIKPVLHEDETTSLKYRIGSESVPNDKELVVTTPADIATMENVFLLDKLNNTLEQNNDTDVLNTFLHALDDLERAFYLSTFTKLSTNGPSEKAENGISFVQSGLLLHLMLTALTTTVDPTTRAEIEACNNFPASEKVKLHALRLAVGWLPKSSRGLRFRWSTRLLLGPRAAVSAGFPEAAAQAQMVVDTLNSTDPRLLADTLNHMIEKDSGGAMRDTFDEDDLSEGVDSVLLSTMFVRGGWRAAPTLLGQPRPFRDARRAPQPTRMVRVNDVVGYAELAHWDAEAVELSYATPGLSLLLLVPRGLSLRALAGHVARAGVRALPALAPRRLAVCLPLYTLRMTLLLPNKLQDMGITRLVSPPGGNDTDGDSLKVSHAVQRLMFWSEAGRNAFKDDGIEWDEAPEMEMLLDRPYLFFVRWHNVTLMNGHFVL